MRYGPLKEVKGARCFITEITSSIPRKNPVNPQIPQIQIQTRSVGIANFSEWIRLINNWKKEYRESGSIRTANDQIKEKEIIPELEIPSFELRTQKPEWLCYKISPNQTPLTRKNSLSSSPVAASKAPSGSVHAIVRISIRRFEDLQNQMYVQQRRNPFIKKSSWFLNYWKFSFRQLTRVASSNAVHYLSKTQRSSLWRPRKRLE